MFFKNITKIVSIAKTAGSGNLCYAHGSLQQKIISSFNAGTGQILAEVQAGNLFEFTGKNGSHSCMPERPHRLTKYPHENAPKYTVLLAVC